MTDKETTQWFDTIFYGGKCRPIMLATKKDKEQKYLTYFPVYSYVVVDPEELERCTFYKSERNNVSLIRHLGLHMGLCIGDTYVKMVTPFDKAEVCEGSGLFCFSYNHGNTTHVLLYDIRHGMFVFQRPVSNNKPGIDEIQDKIREIVENDRDVTAGQMYRQLVTWSNGTSLIYIYDTEKDWACINFGYLSPENVETLLMERPDKE